MNPFDINGRRFLREAREHRRKAEQYLAAALAATEGSYRQAQLLDRARLHEALAS